MRTILPVLLLLAACAGGEDDADTPVDTDDSRPVFIDDDADGVGADRDCDDSDDTVFPGAREVCDGKDNDCDGLVDDADSSLDQASATPFYEDADRDGVGDALLGYACSIPAGRSGEAGDCDDGDPARAPGRDEVCDGVDNDCNDAIDDGLSDVDADGICDGRDLCVGEDVTGDADGDGVCDDEDTCLGDDATGDADVDGVCDSDDACVGDDLTGDADADGVCDDLDACLGDDATGDTDGDGTCDSDDLCLGDDLTGDVDGDGVCGDQDVCVGTDAVGDRDGDGVCDDADPCPDDAPDDSDGDGSCDSVDLCLGDDTTGDDDGDGVCADLDGCFGDDTTGDRDGDGTCDDRDPCPDDRFDDRDGDGVCDSDDLCRGDDAIGDADGDGFCDDRDACTGDDRTGDSDGDGVCDDTDVCPLDDPDDSDGDRVCDSDDLCLGDDATGDTDGDGLCDERDVEECDGVDNDGDGDVDEPDIWWDERLPYRVPLQVTAPLTGDLEAAPIVVELDLAQLLAEVGDPSDIDPDSLRVVRQVCDPDLVPVPFEFADDLLGLLDALDPEDPIDGRGTLVFTYDEDGDPTTREALPAAASVPFALYFASNATSPGLPPAPDTTALVADVLGGTGELSNDHAEAFFGLATGGMLNRLAPAGRPPTGTQGPVLDGNGLFLGNGWVRTVDGTGATLDLVHAGPRVGVLRTDGRVANAAGGYRYQYTWVLFDGRPELYATVRITTDRQTRVGPFGTTWSDAVRPYLADNDALAGAALSEGGRDPLGDLWAFGGYSVGGARPYGIAAGWRDAPDGVGRPLAVDTFGPGGGRQGDAGAFVGLTGQDVEASPTSDSLVVPARTVILEDRQMILWPFLGLWDDDVRDPMLGLLQGGPVVDVARAQAR